MTESIFALTAHVRLCGGKRLYEYDVPEVHVYMATILSGDYNSTALGHTMLHVDASRNDDECTPLYSDGTVVRILHARAFARGNQFFLTMPITSVVSPRVGEYAPEVTFKGFVGGRGARNGGAGGITFSCLSGAEDYEGCDSIIK
jgi:hypothetical protein